MLSRDPGCLRDLLWRIELPRPQDAGPLADRLEALGWQENSRVPQVRDLEGPAGHRLVIVPRTGRIQIRVHYLTALVDRAREASRLHDTVLIMSGATAPHGYGEGASV